MAIQSAEAQTSTLAKLAPPHTTAHKLRHKQKIGLVMPCTEGLTDEATEVVVVALVTTCNNGLEVLPVKLESQL